MNIEKAKSEVVKAELELTALDKIIAVDMENIQNCMFSFETAMDNIEDVESIEYHNLREEQHAIINYYREVEEND